MVTRFVVNYYILPIDVNAVALQNVVITTFCNVTTFWVATKVLSWNGMNTIASFIIFVFNFYSIHLFFFSFFFWSVSQLTTFSYICDGT